MKILFVCSSNVCRSPYCEFTLKRLVEGDDALKGKIEVCSAGVVNRSRELFKKGRARLEREGYDPRALDAFKPCYKKDCLCRFESADVIIGMSRAHKLFLPRRFWSKYVTLSQAATGKYSAIPDPFLGSEKDYNAAMDRLNEYVTAYFEKLKATFAESDK